MHFPHNTPEMSSTEIMIVHDPPIVSQARNVCIHHCSSYSQNLHATPFNEHASPIPYPPLFGAKLPSRSRANDGELACLSFLTGGPTAKCFPSALWRKMRQRCIARSRRLNSCHRVIGIHLPCWDDSLLRSTVWGFTLTLRNLLINYLTTSGILGNILGDDVHAVMFQRKSLFCFQKYSAHVVYMSKVQPGTCLATVVPRKFDISARITTHKTTAIRGHKERHSSTNKRWRRPSTLRQCKCQHARFLVVRTRTDIIVYLKLPGASSTQQRCSFLVDRIFLASGRFLFSWTSHVFPTWIYLTLDISLSDGVPKSEQRPSAWFPPPSLCPSRILPTRLGAQRKQPRTGNACHDCFPWSSYFPSFFSPLFSVESVGTLPNAEHNTSP